MAEKFITSGGAAAIESAIRALQVANGEGSVAVAAAIEDLEAVIEDLGYEFTINGVNFNGYAKIKTLMLTSECKAGKFLTFKHYNSVPALEDYQVPGVVGEELDKVFIVFQALIHEDYETGIAVVGESDAAHSGDTGSLEKKILFLANGTNRPFMTPCYGVFTAGSYVTASSQGYDLQSGTALYGIEVDA